MKTCAARYQVTHLSAEIPASQAAFGVKSPARAQGRTIPMSSFGIRMPPYRDFFDLGWAEVFMIFLMMFHHIPSYSYYV